MWYIILNNTSLITFILTKATNLHLKMPSSCQHLCTQDADKCLLLQAPIEGYETISEDNDVYNGVSITRHNWCPSLPEMHEEISDQLMDVTKISMTLDFAICVHSYTGCVTVSDFTGKGKT